MSADRAPLPLRHAVALGLLQGPTELLPVSSSAHTSLLPWLAGWRYGQLEPASRKAFEVALHAGAGLALAIDMRGELLEELLQLDRRASAVIVLSLAPSAIAGYTLQGPIERRLGGPRSIAVGLVLGGVAMALADARPSGAERAAGRPGPLDGLALGLAQAAALAPGVSRSGAALSAARALGFGRREAQALSWHAGLPVILGASVLEARRLARRGLPAGLGAALGAGCGAAFLSTLLSARLLRARASGGRGGRTLWPYSLYRGLLAALVLRRLRSAHNRSG
jgi:undecaprenyl-diphosphatase